MYASNNKAHVFLEVTSPIYIYMVYAWFGWLSGMFGFMSTWRAKPDVSCWNGGASCG